MAYADVFEYGDNLRQIAARSGLPSEVGKITVLVRDRKRATQALVIVDHIRFRNGATIYAEEDISIVSGQIIRHLYSYHFQNGSFFSRYDKDPEAAQGREYAHAACHLHVSGSSQENMRYISHETSFEQVFRFILASVPSVSG